MNRKLAIVLWLLGLPGILVLLRHLLQTLPAGPAEVSVGVVAAASGAQYGLLLTAAVYAGARLAHRTGLQAPLLSAWLERRPLAPALRALCMPAVGGGLCGVAILAVYQAVLPSDLRLLQQSQAVPLEVRLLYGGITEEILLRWGLMSLLAWGLWRVWRGRPGHLPAAAAWTAIGLSALLFGIAHLPAAFSLFGERAPDAVLPVLAANTAFGVVAGLLYWRRGLEAAILGHMLAHAGFAALTMFRS